jgi:hypothetical protein
VSIDIEDEDIIITAGGIIQLKGEVIVGNAYKDDNFVATRGWVKGQGYGSGSADLSNYYTKEQINSYVSGLEVGISTVDSKFANYYNKEGVHSYVSQEINTFSEENLGTAASYGVTTSVTSGSTSLVTSGAVASALNGYLPLSGGTMDRNAGITWNNGYYDSDAVGSHLSVLADTTQDNSLAIQTGYSYNAILNVGGGGIDSYRFQLASYATSDNFLFYRGYEANSNKWKNWVEIIHSGNIGDYALPLKNGGSISLTETWTTVNIKNWGISILSNTSGGWAREYVVGNEGYDNASIRFG